MTSEKRSGSSGLGRNLAGILGDALSSERAPEVSDLLGVAKIRRDPEVRRLVTELALDALAVGFDAEGVIIAARDTDGALSSVSTRLPSSWNSLDPYAFETVGRLWTLLASDACLGDASASLELMEVDALSVLTCACSTDERPMAAAVLRTTPFSDQEQKTISRLLQSVANALYGSGTPPTDAPIRVLTREAGEGLLADVRLGEKDGRRNAAAVAPDTVTAVARAAAELCDSALEVQFAGQSRVQGCLVTVVTLTDALGGPLFGLAVTDPASMTGPAEAVFSAARVANYDPFVSVDH